MERYKSLIKKELIARYGKGKWGLYYGNLMRKSKSFIKYSHDYIFEKAQPHDKEHYVAFGILNDKTFYREFNKASELKFLTIDEIQKRGDIARLQRFAESYPKENVIARVYDDSGRIIKKEILSPYTILEKYKNGEINRMQLNNLIAEYKTTQDYIYRYGQGD